MKKKSFFKYIYMIYFSMFVLITKVNAAKINCSSFGDVRTDMQNIFNFAKILVPILIIVLTIFDFISAVTSGNEKEIKKTMQRLMKRIVYAVIFMFLPLIINFLLKIIGESNVCIS